MTEGMSTQTQQEFYRSLAESYKNDYHTTVAVLTSALERQLQCEAEYEGLDETAFLSESTAQEAEKAYQAAAEEAVLLAAEQSNRQMAAQLTNSLAQDAMNSQLNVNTAYNTLLEKALAAVRSASASAKAELEDVETHYAQTEKKQLRLGIEAATSRLSAAIANLQKASNNDTRHDVAFQVFYQDTRSKILSTRINIAQELASIAEQRDDLQQTIARYEDLSIQAQELAENNAYCGQEIAKLSEELSRLGTEIIPYQNKITELSSMKNRLDREIENVQKEMERVGQYRDDLAASLENKKTLLEEKQVALEKERQALEERNKTNIQAAEENLTSVKTQKSQAEETLLQLKEKQRQIDDIKAHSKKTLADCISTVQNAQATVEETTRMLANLQTAKKAMKSDSSSVLDNTEKILTNTLNTAKELAVKKEQEIQEIQANLERTGIQAEDMVKQISEAELNVLNFTKDCNTANSAYQAIIKIAEENLKELAYAGEQNLRTAQAAVKQADAALKTVLADWERKQRKKESLKLKIDETNEALQREKVKRDELQGQIDERNQSMEYETSVHSSDLDKKLLFIWEQSETLRARAEELQEGIKHAIERTYLYADNEQKDLQKLNQEIILANKKRQQLKKDITDMIAAVYAARLALEKKQEDMQALDKEDQNALANTAQMLMETAKSLEEDLGAVGEEEPPYENSLGESPDLDSNLLQDPIYSIDQEAYIPKPVLISMEKEEGLEEKQADGDKEEDFLPDLEIEGDLIVSESAETEEAAEDADDLKELFSQIDRQLAASKQSEEEREDLSASTPEPEQMNQEPSLEQHKDEEQDLLTAMAAEIAAEIIDAAEEPEIEEPEMEAPAMENLEDEASITAISAQGEEEESSPLAEEEESSLPTKEEAESPSNGGEEVLPPEETVPGGNEPETKDALVESLPEEEPATEATGDQEPFVPAESENAPSSSGDPVPTQEEMDPLFADFPFLHRQEKNPEKISIEELLKEDEATAIQPEKEAEKETPSPDLTQEEKTKRGFFRKMGSIFSSHSDKEAPEEAQMAEKNPPTEIEDAQPIEKEPSSTALPETASAAASKQTEDADSQLTKENAPSPAEPQEEIAPRLTVLQENVRKAKKEAADQVERLREQNQLEAEKEQTEDEAAKLSQEIEAVRNRINAEKDRLRLTGVEEEKAAKEAAAKKAAEEAAKIAEEEALAQKRAEEAALRFQEEQQRKESAEAERLAKIATELTEKITTSGLPGMEQRDPPQKEKAAVSSNTPPDADDDDDDMEKELRRLIFSNFK